MRPNRLTVACVLASGLSVWLGASPRAGAEAPSSQSQVMEQLGLAPASKPEPANPPAGSIQLAHPLFLANGVSTQPTFTFSKPGPVYRGGRGLITLQGMAGMFLNPTSGTLNQGQFTAQYCVFFDQYSTNTIGQGLMLDYGVTD